MGDGKIHKKFTINSQKFYLADIIYIRAEKRESLQKTPLFSLAIYNMHQKQKPGTINYIENPNQTMYDTINTLSKDLKEKLLDKEVFEYVSETILADFEKFQPEDHRDIMRIEFVHAIVSQIEERDFVEKVTLFKKCAVLLSEQEKRQIDKKRNRKMNELKAALSEIEELKKIGSYDEARRKVLEILTREENLDLTTSVSFIDKVIESLSYKTAANHFEKLAGNSTILHDKKTYYSKAAEEYNHYNNTQKYKDMMANVQTTRQEIEEKK
ncbi:MAG: hypothetical protein LBD98_05330 [Endomicrobium sp.]|jgi:hypothetical protein|nr:hypothetical protein [Endomicrobium sp.]